MVLEILCLKKLKIILLFSLIILFFINLNKKSLYNLKDTNLIGTVTNVEYKNGNTYLEVQGKEKVLVNYYDYIELELGNIVSLEGNFKLPNSTHNFNLFNYQNYLRSKNIFYIFEVNQIKIINNDINIFYKIKNKLISRVNDSINYQYFKLFLFGENNLNDEINNSYKINGISHLFAISGMHITLFSTLLLFILKCIFKNEKIRYMITIIFLLFYIFLTNFSISVIRAVLLFIIIYIVKLKKWNIKTSKIIFVLFIINICLNPYLIYNTGFLFSYTISYFLNVYSSIINNFKNYFVKTFITSFISFLISLPIMINFFFEINLLSSIINIIFVPLISFIIFPFTLITFFFPFFDQIYYVIVSLMEQVSLFLNNYSALIILKKLSILGIIFYYFLIIFILNKMKKKKYKYIILIFVTIFIHTNLNKLNFNAYVTVIDVGQGDSILIELPNDKKNILIDIGGKYIYKNGNLELNNLSKNIHIPFFKSLGIKRIDYLILTHGDLDHMGDAINLVNDFKVEKVIFNNGEFNDLELKLIKVLKEKNILYYKNIKELNIDDNKLYFLNNEIYDNENNNSNVIYTKLSKYKFLLMGDAGVEVEDSLLEKYNLTNIDVLKVGHHGSKTSSSKNFVDVINPKYSVISVGKNNRYGHPNNEVLDNLTKSKIYRTDMNGSIMFKIKKNKLEIKTYVP